MQGHTLIVRLSITVLAREAVQATASDKLVSMRAEDQLCNRTAVHLVVM